MSVYLPTPHGDKLQALLANEKLPVADKPQVIEAAKRYHDWLQQMRAVSGTMAEKVVALVNLLNSYKRFVELELIFDSKEDFLYRQKGQLKLDNTILEEFLPHLVQATLFVEKPHDLTLGPTTSFSGIRFESSISRSPSGGGMQIRTKAHDFAISRQLYIQTSHQADFADSIVKETHVAYVAAECKTNLDKTMFQEAAATAADVKIAVPGARYYLLCEWLDMTPINTNSTAIDEILILRKAKRLPAAIRSEFSTMSGRQSRRDWVANFLDSNPLSAETFLRFVSHIDYLIRDGSEDDILQRGYF